MIVDKISVLGASENGFAILREHGMNKYREQRTSYGQYVLHDAFRNSSFSELQFNRLVFPLWSHAGWDQFDYSDSKSAGDVLHGGKVNDREHSYFLSARGLVFGLVKENDITLGDHVINTNPSGWSPDQSRVRSSYKDRFWGQDFFWLNVDLDSEPGYVKTSDIRLKNVGEVYVGGLDAISQLNPYHFTFKDDEAKTPQVGVMAQDLQKVFPDSVTADSEGWLRIRWDEMFYAAINAIKELNTKISDVIKDITSLKELSQKQQATIDSQSETIQELRDEIAKLSERIEKLESSKK